MSNRIAKHLLMIGGAALSAGAAAPAVSAAEGSIVDRDAAPTVVVPHGDLDLNTVEGRERLETRMRGAIRYMCRAYFRPTLRQRAEEQDCMEHARRSAEPQVAALLSGRNVALTLERPAALAAP